jgi:hypothetical protein
VLTHTTNSTRPLPSASPTGKVVTAGAGKVAMGMGAVLGAVVLGLF